MSPWKTDPDLKILRDEFIGALRERRKELRPLMDALESDPESPEILRQIQDMAHKTAGIAGSYGFTALTRVGGVVDEYLDLVLGNRLAVRDPVLPTVQLFDELLEAAAGDVDRGDIAQDPRLVVLLKYF